MKKRAIILTLCLSSCLFAVTLGVPQTISFSTYAINDYSHFATDLGSLDRSIAHKKRFVEKMTDEITDKYPSTSISTNHNRENSAATTSRFLSDNTDLSDFVFFAGHGNQQRLSFYDNGFNFVNGNKKFGGNTKWVILDACLFLNANNANQKSSDPSNNSSVIDNARLTNIKKMFNGVHAILGYHSKSWQGNIKKHWYSSAQWRTEDKYNHFAKYFIRDGRGLWDAYSAAVYKHYDDFVNNHAAGWTTNLSGYRSAIAYFYGDYNNGNVIDMSLETYKLTWKGPITSSSGNFKFVDIKMAYSKAGTPKY